MAPLDALTDGTDGRFRQTTGGNRQPSKTWRLDFETGEVRRPIDGERAIRQFVRKTIMTERFRYAIYSAAHGCELESLIGANVTDNLKNEEIPRLVREALVVDDRIADATNFEVTREKDAVFVSFEVVTVDDFRVGFDRLEVAT
ncbi:DUF2634 domain-containing protein [Salibacterium salarium]|uniref:DUF2634 domain-containing protein n=1 Tax=Salibacterium salarium TaxID=284579 RepID=A0A428MS47_9BACI|nr:DUF2634 domain-containing protein [Salibacterium salarium]RSL28988.1 DUF2634 domain-containing protein [Salibacterium salarium]